MRYPDLSTVSMEYDFAGRLADVGGYATFTHNLAGGVDTIVYSNGVLTEYTYDNRNRSTNIATTRSGASLLNLTYEYDGSGSVTSIDNGTYTEYYDYDLLDRLNSTEGEWGNVTYGYDPVGNCVSKTVQGGYNTSYWYSCMNELT